jgi:hypothetical protein
MDLNEITQETIEMVKKATTSGLLVSTGVQGVDLSGLVSLVPVNVPARNNVSAFPRVIAGAGSQTAVWRALLNVNGSQPNAAVGMDYAGSLALVAEQDVYAPYKPLAMAGRVTLDAVAVARNYVDALAVSELQTLNQLFIAQDINIINAQNWSLGTAPTPTLATATTGGSIPLSTAVYVKCAPRSGMNYFYGGADAVGAAQNITTGGGTSTNTVTASVPAVKGAVAYDWYVGGSATAATQYYYGTTTIASVVITAIPVAANAVPALPLISSVAPPANASLAVTDNSFSANYYNGILASTLGDYGSLGPVTPGLGTASGAVFVDNGGAALTASGAAIPALDNLNDKLWASVQLSPTAYMVASAQADEISNLMLSSTAALTFLPPTDAQARTNLSGGGYVGTYINKAAGGVPVSIEVHPHLAPGTIIARTDRVPFPGSNIGSAFQVRCQYDTMRFDYAANYNPGTLGGGPRYDFEIRSMETLVNFAPVAQGILANVA